MQSRADDAGAELPPTARAVNEAAGAADATRVREAESPGAGPSSFLTLKAGTPVFDRFGLPVGDVDQVLIAHHSFFDGIIVRGRVGRRFVDAPEVAQITQHRVQLSIGCHDVEYPGEPKILGAYSARQDPGPLVEDDRTAVIEALKLAYVRDMLGTDQLATAVQRASTARTPGDLEHLIPPIG